YIKRMNMARGKVTTVEEYIAAAPEQAQKSLREIRAILQKVAPQASEVIKWGVPVYEEDRILFSYASHKFHLNFMPTGPAMEPFRAELVAYRTGKDTIQFPYDEPLPKTLIRKIASHRVKEVRQKDAKWMY